MENCMNVLAQKIRFRTIYTYKFSFAIIYGNNNMVHIFLPKLIDEETEILKILVY